MKSEENEKSFDSYFPPSISCFFRVCLSPENIQSVHERPHSQFCTRISSGEILVARRPRDQVTCSVRSSLALIRVPTAINRQYSTAIHHFTPLVHRPAAGYRPEVHSITCWSRSDHSSTSTRTACGLVTPSVVHCTVSTTDENRFNEKGLCVN